MLSDLLNDYKVYLVYSILYYQNFEENAYVENRASNILFCNKNLEYNEK